MHMHTRFAEFCEILIVDWLYNKIEIPLKRQISVNRYNKYMGQHLLIFGSGLLKMYVSGYKGRNTSHESTEIYRWCITLATTTGFLCGVEYTK